jgi:hypothetical protein
MSSLTYNVKVIYSINDLASYIITDFYSEEHIKSMNKPCGQIVQILMLE